MSNDPIGIRCYVHVRGPSLTLTIKVPHRLDMLTQHLPTLLDPLHCGCRCHLNWLSNAPSTGAKAFWLSAGHVRYSSRRFFQSVKVPCETSQWDVGCSPRRSSLKSSSQSLSTFLISPTLYRFLPAELPDALDMARNKCSTTSKLEQARYTHSNCHDSETPTQTKVKP